MRFKSAILFGFSLLFFSCGPQTKVTKISSQNTSEESSQNFINVPADSLFTYVELDLKEINATEFERYKNLYKPTCQIDTSGSITNTDLSIKRECNEICIANLVDETDGKMLELPCNFDQGVMGLSFSPSCNQMLSYSCYDGPDFDNYYEYRSEIFGFAVASGKGLKTVSPLLKYYTKDWSIASLIWVDDKAIALKVYSQEMPSKGNVSGFQYFMAYLSK